MNNDKKPIGVWIEREGYQAIYGKSCKITLERRPPYCDRGRFLAKLHALGLHIDCVDGWNPGRYYFDEAVAKSECEAWLHCRNQIGDECDRNSPKPISDITMT